MVKRLGVTALVAGLVMAAPVSAQQGQGGGMRMMGGGMPPMEVLKKELALTAEQEPKVQKILDAFTADIKEPRETLMENMQMIRDGITTREAVQADNSAAMARITERGAKATAELKGVLTEEQFAKYEAYLEAQRARRMGGQRPPPVR